MSVAPTPHVPVRWKALRRFLVASLVIVALVAAVTAGLSYDPLPRTIVFATGAPGGLYHEVAVDLKPQLEKSLGRKLIVLSTSGSGENATLLRNGTAHLAILQDGAVTMDGMQALAPLYYDVIHVLVRKDSSIQAVRELKGHAVVVGRAGSGMRSTALVLLEHYGVQKADVTLSEGYFLDLLTDPGLDAAIVTTGVLNRDLAKLIRTGQFRLLPIPDAAGLATHHRHLTPWTIPAGTFEGPAPLPEESVPTIATVAYIAAADNVSRNLVRQTLTSLYAHDRRQQIPTLFTISEARMLEIPRLHPDTTTFFDPYGGVEIMSSLLESLAAIKELLLAALASMFLIWSWWQGIRLREDARALQILKDRLDTFLDETIRLETEHIQTADPVRLQGLLDEITRVKLRALNELTHEDLRGDRMFSIFLLQCGDLATKIQAKLAALSRLAPADDPAVPTSAEVRPVKPKPSAGTHFEGHDP